MDAEAPGEHGNNGKPKWGLPDELAERLAPTVAKALRHPLRRRILRALLRNDQAKSPAELAYGPLVGETVSGVSYHMKVLLASRLVRETRTKQVRGALQHFYRPTISANPQIIVALERTMQQDGDSSGHLA